MPQWHSSLFTIGDITVWMLKTYRSSDRYGKPTLAAMRRVNSLNRPYDLGKHSDRKEIGYCYLEWLS